VPPLFTIVFSTLFWAALATSLVMALGLPLAFLLSRRSFPGHRLLLSLVTLPLVLPPTAVGFLLLRLLADGGPLGRDTLGFDPGLVLTWRGVVLACAVMSFPLVVRTAKAAFDEVDPGLAAIARTLGCGPLAAFFRVTLPLAARGLVAAALLGFTRAMGEFGASVTIAGSIPGKTQTLSAAIYGAQQGGDPGRAGVLVAIALSVGFLAIFATELLAHPYRRKR